jgi:hypothetical protein
MWFVNCLVSACTRIIELAFGERLAFWVVQYLVRNVYEIEERC